MRDSKSAGRKRRTEPPRVTLQDVAERAGVSLSTATRVVSEGPRRVGRDLAITGRPSGRRARLYRESSGTRSRNRPQFHARRCRARHRGPLFLVDRVRPDAGVPATATAGLPGQHARRRGWRARVPGIDAGAAGWSTWARWQRSWCWTRAALGSPGCSRYRARLSCGTALLRCRAVADLAVCARCAHAALAGRARAPVTSDYRKALAVHAVPSAVRRLRDDRNGRPQVRP